MRKPKWHRDEIILALDLYFDKDLGSVKSNPKIVALSELLKQLSFYIDRPDAGRPRHIHFDFRIFKSQMDYFYSFNLINF
jgi:5-methylcytosine-specific restriction protein A